MAILILQEDVEIREKLVFSLEATFGDEVIQASDVREALKLLHNEPKKIHLVIYDQGAADQQAVGPKALDLEMLFKMTEDARLVICQDPKSRSAPPLKWKVLTNVDRTQIISNLLRVLSQFGDAGVIELGPYEKDFCKIKTKLLLSVCPLNGDIFIRLSEKKFVKLFLQGDAFDLADMEKYTIKRGVSHLFLKKDDAREFIEKYNNDLQKIIQTSKTLNFEEAAKMHESIYETAQELGERLGFTEDVQRLAKSHVQLTMKQIGRNPRLSLILEKLRSYGGGYLGAHSAITGYMACAIASHLEWGSDVTFNKLTLAAFLHDMTLNDHKLAHCNTLEEVKDAGYTPTQVAEYKTHPIKAAQIARTFQEVPPDVDSIILQHHERPDATGFPRGIGHSYMAPLAMVFIVAHDMAQYFLDHGSKLDIDDFLSRTRDHYKSSQFRKIIEAIEKLN